MNHDKSSGAMEGADAVKMFSRSIDKQVQKRLGTRLRKICKTYRRTEKIIKNGKEVEKIIKLTGKGKLTESIINSLQNYYGSAIRGNKGQLYPMKKAVAAVLHH